MGHSGRPTAALGLSENSGASNSYSAGANRERLLEMQAAADPAIKEIEGVCRPTSVHNAHPADSRRFA
jgi:hypothetical protein